MSASLTAAQSLLPRSFDGSSITFAVSETGGLPAVRITMTEGAVELPLYYTSVAKAERDIVADARWNLSGAADAWTTERLVWCAELARRALASL